jgi:hypothetical protein
MTKTAKGEFEILINDNQELLKMLGEELEKWAASDPDWCGVGSLQHIKYCQIKLLVWMRGAEEEEQMHRKIDIELKNRR